MDILYLLDRLEEVLSSGPTVPFTTRKLVDEQECLDILDQIRVAVPEEIKAARRLTQEREQLLASARAEAERLLQDAEHHMESQVSQHAIVAAAEARAAQIEEAALQEADEMRREAEEYAYRLLERLRGRVDQIGQAVDRGLRDLAPEPEDTAASR